LKGKNNHYLPQNKQRNIRNNFNLTNLLLHQQEMHKAMMLTQRYMKQAGQNQVYNNKPMEYISPKKTWLTCNVL